METARSPRRGGRLTASVLLLLAACGGHTRPCASGTAFITLSFDSAAAAADQIAITVTVGTGSMTFTRPHTPSATSDTAEIVFDKGYPAGAMISVVVVALVNGVEVGGGQQLNSTLDPSCSSLSISVTGQGAPDGGGADLVADAGTFDATRPDLAVLTVTPATATLGTYRALRLTANETATWSILEGAAGGKVDSSGVYVAPATRGTYHVIATSSGHQAMATLTVVTPTMQVLAGKPGGPGFTDGPVATARFANPTTMASDGTGGAVYVADPGNKTLRKIAGGNVTTFAGSAGLQGFADGVGPAARFSYGPQLVTIIGPNLYLLDSQSLRQVVLATGAVTTLLTVFALNGISSMAGDSQGHLFFSHYCAIEQFTLSDSTTTVIAGQLTSCADTDGTGTSARFMTSGPLTFDGAGNLYMGDQQKLKQIVVSSGVVTTVAGQTSKGAMDGNGAAASFNGMTALVFDGAGHLYASDWLATDGFTRIRKITLSNDNVSTFGAVQLPTLYSPPGGMTLDGSGNLLLTVGNAIKSVSLSSGQTTVIAGSQPNVGTADGAASSALFSQPASLAAGLGGTLYEVDLGSSSLRKIDAAGTVNTLLSQGWAPFDITFDGNHGAFASDFGSNDIYSIDLSLKTKTLLAGASNGQSGSADGIGTAARFNFGQAGGVAVDPVAGIVYVADTFNQTVRAVTVADGTTTTLAGTAGQGGEVDGTGSAARFYSPMGLALDGAGNLFVAERLGVRRIALASGAVTTLAGGGGNGSNPTDGTGTNASFAGIRRIAWDGVAMLYVTDGPTVRQIEVSSGTVRTLAGVSYLRQVITGPLPAGLNDPEGIAVLPNGDIAVSDGVEESILVLQAQ